jgi:hypothetical protein
MEDKRPPQEA